MSQTYFSHVRLRIEKPSRWQCSPPQEEVRGFELSAKKNEEQEAEEIDVNCPQNTYGHIYHSGPQSLCVTVPGDVVPVKFSKESALSGLRHDADSPELVINETGIYEISYCVCVQAEISVYAAFALQVGGENIEGSIISRLLNTSEIVYSSTVLSELKKNSTIRLVMTSSSVVSAVMKNTGVTASLIIKKLNSSS